MASKISIGVIGLGWVGSSVAISALHTGAAQELLLYDIKPELAEGEAMDLSHGSPYYASADIKAAQPDEMLNTKAVVIAAGRGGKPQESRLNLLQDNVGIIRQLAQHFVDYKGIVILVSNPVDVLTYVFQKASGLPSRQVIGTGTMLDTARLRQVMGRELQVHPRSIHAQVVGEHGDSEVVLWSSASLGGTSLREWPGWNKGLEKKIANEVKTAAQQIIQRKGATNHAIGLVTANLIRYLIRGDRRILTVSSLQTGTLGIRDVALSLPTIVDGSGATEILVPNMDKMEEEAIRKSAKVLQKAIGSIN